MAHVVKTTIAPTTYSGYTTLVTADTFTENFEPWRQYIPFQIQIDGDFDSATYNNAVAYTDDPGTRIFRFVNRLNQNVEVDQLLRYQKNCCGRSIPLDVVYDRAYNVIRVMSCITPTRLTPTPQPIVPAP